VAGWTFLTSHARVLLLVAHDPGVRLRDIAASLDITERSAFHIQAHLPLPESTSRERTVGEVLALLTGADATVTGKSATAGSLDPGSGKDRQRAAAE
jgi:hypothetical protein